MTAAVLDRPVIQAVHIGPTWEVDPDWDGFNELFRYILPERSLGWQIIDWIEGSHGRPAMLLADETDEFGDRQPFRCTREQKRFLLWWYAIDDRGRFIFRDGVLQRLKGWGKDPIVAVIAAVEFVGPCRFGGWITDEAEAHELGLEVGDPRGIDHPRAWIQIAAVSKDQTRNTMTLFPGLFSPACMAACGIKKGDIGKEIIYAQGGSRRIEAVTSSPRAIEGGRPTFVVRNETHHWIASNEGHEMAAVIDRNVTKSKDGAARALSITNAYDPADDSVAQHERESWELQKAGLSIDTGVLYDSLEAPDDARLRPPKSADGIEPSEAEIRAYIGAVIEAVRGDASWLDVERIVNSILDPQNPPSRSRRFYYNQIVASEDAWCDPKAIRAAVNPLVNRSGLTHSVDMLRAGWLAIPTEPVVMFFDGSKSRDATGLIGCTVEDGDVFTIGVWQKPAGEAGKTWTVPRNEVDERVDEAFDRFNIIAFWGDPSHAQDDDATRYWDGYLDAWHRRYKDRLRKEAWAVTWGTKAHSIMWDMTSPERQAQFVAGAEMFVEEIENLDDDGLHAPLFRHDGHPALIDHLGNARRYPTRWGVSLWKGSRESAKKVDLAVCAVGARMLRRLVLNKAVEEPESDQPGELWGSW